MARKRKEYRNRAAFRTLLLWLGWTGSAIAVPLLVYPETNLWSFIQEDQSKITSVILALFAAGVIMSFILTISITEEALQAATLGRIAKEQSLSGVHTDDSTLAVQRFFASLKHILERSNTEPDIEALIDVEMAGYQRRSHAVEVIGNLLITLGLIGTVIGLTLTLAGLSSSLASLGEDPQRLMQGLETAMGGMGTAFFTTLLGAILGGVLLRIYALITTHGIDGLSDMLKKICMVYCASDVKPSVERDMRSLNSEITVLGDNIKLLRAALADTKDAMHDFHVAANKLREAGSEGEMDETLRNSVVLQMYYTDLLKEEIKLVNRVNRSWWGRLRRSIDALKSRG